MENSEHPKHRATLAALLGIIFLAVGYARWSATDDLLRTGARALCAPDSQTEERSFSLRGGVRTSREVLCRYQTPAGVVTRSFPVDEDYRRALEHLETMVKLSEQAPFARNIARSAESLAAETRDLLTVTYSPSNPYDAVLGVERLASRRQPWLLAFGAFLFLAGVLSLVKGADTPTPEAAEVPSGWKAALHWDGAATFLSWPWAHGLHFGLMAADGKELSWLERSDLGPVSLEEAKAAALRQLAQGAPVEVSAGVFSGTWNDQLAASRLLVPELVEGLPLKGAPIAFTASEDTFVLAGRDDAEALERAFETSRADLERVRAQSSAAGAFTAWPWELVEGAWRPWRVPAEHPLASAIAELERRVGPGGWRAPLAHSNAG